MKVISVTYTIKAGFSEQNQSNISRVMSDLQNANHQGINYHVCLSSDNKTFIHTGFFKSDEDQAILNELPSFKHFQKELKESGLEAAPKQELRTLVGSSNPIFLE